MPFPNQQPANPPPTMQRQPQGGGAPPPPAPRPAQAGPAGGPPAGGPPGGQPQGAAPGGVRVPPQFQRFIDPNNKLQALLLQRIDQLPQQSAQALYAMEPAELMVFKAILPEVGFMFDAIIQMKQKQQGGGGQPGGQQPGGQDAPGQQNGQQPGAPGAGPGPGPGPSGPGPSNAGGPPRPQTGLSSL